MLLINKNVESGKLPKIWMFGNLTIASLSHRQLRSIYSCGFFDYQWEFKRKQITSMYVCRHYYSLLSVSEISHSVEFKFILNHIVAVLIRLSYTFRSSMIVLWLCVNVKKHLLPLFMTLEMGWYFSGINFATEKYSCWFNWYCCKLCSPAISLNGFGFIIQCFCSLYILRWIAHKWDGYSKFFHRYLSNGPCKR